MPRHQGLQVRGYVRAVMYRKQVSLWQRLRPDRRAATAADRAQPGQLTRHPGQDRPVHRRLGGPRRAAAGHRMAGNGNVHQVRATAGRARLGVPTAAERRDVVAAAPSGGRPANASVREAEGQRLLCVLGRVCSRVSERGSLTNQEPVFTSISRRASAGTRHGSAQRTAELCSTGSRRRASAAHRPRSACWRRGRRYRRGRRRADELGDWVRLDYDEPGLVTVAGGSSPSLTSRDRIPPSTRPKSLES